MTTTSATAYARPILAPQPIVAPATAAHGALAGTLVITAYAALEMLVSGPFNLQPDESVGSWYIGALFPYLLIYAGLGALTGLVVGFVLARTGRQRHHVLPTLSAILMVAFAGNAWFFGFPLGGSVFLVGTAGDALGNLNAEVGRLDRLIPMRCPPHVKNVY